MRILILLLVCFNMVFVSQVFGLPFSAEWHLEGGIAAVLDPGAAGGNIVGEAGGRDISPMSQPEKVYYWIFDGLVRAKNILGDFVEGGDGTAWRDVELYRAGDTYILHGDKLWGQPGGTIYGVSVESYFAGEIYYQMIDGEWYWQSTIGTSQVKGVSSDRPFRFELTNHVYFDYYGYSDIVGYNFFSGKVTEAVKSIFPIPEPSTMLLFGAGIASLAAVRRWRK